MNAATEACTMARREAFAQLQGARTLWLPTIRAGMSYNHHDGPLQATEGPVIPSSRSALGNEEVIIYIMESREGLQLHPCIQLKLN